ncbi:uncharacterized protein TNCV_4730381 [Trichonephila clavipes]|nr:uncharacterized protein TNCV_4730381 [Trichonephila clavipes]
MSWQRDLPESMAWRIFKETGIRKNTKNCSERCWSGKKCHSKTIESISGNGASSTSARARENAMANAFWVSVRNNISKRWNTTENDGSKNQSSADSAIRLPNTSSRVARDKPWSTLCKKSHGIPSSPRAAAVDKFRLLTGHDCLCAHLFRFNLVTSPICVLCDTGQDMTAAHLDECSALNDHSCIVKRYWRARCLMT